MNFTRDSQILSAMRSCDPRPRTGYVTGSSGPIINAAFDGVGLSSLCEIERFGAPPLFAEVIGVSGHNLTLSPFGSTDGVSAGQNVRTVDGGLRIMAGSALAGRVIDAFGEPIDGLGDYPDDANLLSVPVRRNPLSPMDRPLIETPFLTGFRAIDGPNTLGHGQRIGVFGPPGVGKTHVLAGIARACSADYVVLGLVGERGREVREFLDRSLPLNMRSRVTTVVATSDRPAVERALCAQTATAVAEAMRDEGCNVVLMIDSLTRMARALREIGLAAGEPPARRGYPASVYPALPRLIERAGCANIGSITAIYTVLTEDSSDPIADEVRSLTDGHVVLSPELAQEGHWPAIDILKSMSRLIDQVTDADHARTASQMRARLAKYEELELLIQVGEYRTGNDPESDRAIASRPKISAFLQQQIALDEPLEDIARQMRTAIR